MTDNELQNRYITARRTVIDADFAHLNDMQREAVMTTEGPLLLLAGAGSGKTTVLINRIANLLKYGGASDSTELPPNATEENLLILEKAASDPKTPEYAQAQRLAALDPVEPWRIIAITFTNKAAGEMKARLEDLLGPEAASDIWAMTFHAACTRILRRDIARIGFAPGFTIYDTSDSQSLMKRIIKDMDLDDKTFPYRMVLSVISKAKDALQSPEDYLQSMSATSDIRKIRIAKAYVEYAKRLREANAMDFDDLLYFAVRLLTDNDDIRDYYQRRFRYVLIDEYQDTNNLQYLLATALAGGHENICVVGDDDQSIYKFRGATIENILSFEAQYKDSRLIRLEQNYRSTGNILNAANAVIKNNLARKGKQLWTKKDSGEQLTQYIAQNEYDEAQFVANTILAGYADGKPWRDHAILYRMNAQSNQLEYAFKRAGIPYRIIGGTRFFDRAEVKDMIAYLNVIQNPGDDLRLTRIINNPTRGIGLRTIETIQELANDAGVSMFSILLDVDRYPQLQRASVRLRLFVNLINELRELMNVLPLDELYDVLLEKTGYMHALKENLSDENIARAENVSELKSNIINYIKESGDSSLEGFLEEVALYTDIEQYDRDADCVVMMTMHSAKGLEFPCVFIVGVEEGIFPGIRSIGEPDEMEEERRLCYVAITRAKEHLYICCAHQRMLFGRTVANMVSRFIREIPDEFINKIGEVPRSRSEFTNSATGMGTVPEKTYTAKKKPVRPAKQPNIPRKAPESAPSTDYSVSDAVHHSAFGHGVIAKMTPMGGDYLVEIEFDEVGLKRLMLRTAAQHMEKESQ